jgi:multiple sugar transport system substrate-binding protein
VRIDRWAVRRQFRLTSLVVGLAAGVALSALYVHYVQPSLVDSGGLEPGELVLVSGEDDSRGKQRQVLVDQWKQLHPNNPVEIVEVRSQSDAERGSMIDRATSGEPVDVYNLDLIWLAEFAERGFVRPLDSSTVDTTGFLKAPLDSCRYSGKLWGLPFNSDAGLLFYHKNLLDSTASLPTTLTSLRRTATAALEEHGQPGQSGYGSQLAAGYTGQFADYEGLTVNALEVIWAEGGEVVDKDGRVVIDATASKGLRWLAEGLAKQAHQIVLPDSRQYHESESTEAFRERRVVFMRNWPVAYQQLRANPGDQQGGSASDVEVTKLPGQSVLGGQNLVIASSSRHPRAAQALIEFLTSERSQQILFERGGFAATREIIYRDPVVMGEYPYASSLLDAISNARPRPQIPHYKEFSEAFRRIVRYALEHNGELPNDAVAVLTDALRGKLR